MKYLYHGTTRENVIKAVNQLAFREAAEIGNMIDNLIKDFLTREGLTFKKVEKPEKMSQKAFDALFGDQGVITRFRDGIIDGDYMVVGASDMVFDKELFENGLVGETDLIAINADGDFNITLYQFDGLSIKFDCNKEYWMSRINEVFNQKAKEMRIYTSLSWSFLDKNDKVVEQKEQVVEVITTNEIPEGQYIPSGIEGNTLVFNLHIDFQERALKESLLKLNPPVLQ